MMLQGNNISVIGQSCTGCSSCVDLCPKKAIKMSPSQEGFLYPMVGDNCIHCGACVKQCPVNDNDVKADSIKQKGYLAITKKAIIFIKLGLRKSEE